MQDSLRQKFNELEEKDKWNEEFIKLKNQTIFKSSPHTLKVARQPENFRKNRYRDVLPYDHTRIKLGSCPDSDYINASLVEIPGTGREHILTQGPLPATSRDFWQMVWEQNSKAVIMLNRVIEKNTIKCHQYFPEKEGEEMPQPMKFDGKAPTFEVTLLEENPTEHYVIRKFELHNLEADEKREVFHYQFVTWPDFGVPESSSDFLEFLHKVRADGCLNRNEFGPPIIHCSAGIGRSGTFIIVDAALVTAKTKGVQNVDILKTVKELRKSRMGLIQTPDQLRFCWLTVLDALEKQEWAELFNTGLYATDQSCFRRSSNEKTLKRPSVSTDLEEPSCPPSAVSPEKENLPTPDASVLPGSQGNSPHKRRRNSGAEAALAKTTTEAQQLVDQIRIGPSSPPCKDDSSSESDSLDVACDSSRSSPAIDKDKEETVESPQLDPRSLGESLATGEIPFADQQPSGEYRRRRKEEKRREMEERLTILKAKMKQSDATGGHSGWIYYVGGALLALGIAGLVALYFRK